MIPSSSSSDGEYQIGDDPRTLLENWTLVLVFSVILVAIIILGEIIEKAVARFFPEEEEENQEIFSMVEQREKSDSHEIKKE